MLLETVSSGGVEAKQMSLNRDWVVAQEDRYIQKETASHDTKIDYIVFWQP